MDRRPSSLASEDICGLSETGDGSTHGLTANASSSSFNRPTRTVFGAFFKTNHFDHRRAWEERYTVSEHKGCSLKGSRVGQFWDEGTRLEMVAQDIFVCFGLPCIAFLPLFFVETEARSYEVQPWWGGCRISTSSGHADGVRLLALQGLTTVLTFAGFLLTCFAIQSFRRRGFSGSAFKLEGLTSLPTKFSLESKSTNIIIRRHLALCLCFTSVLLLSCIVQLAVTVYEFRNAPLQLSARPRLPSPSSLSTQTSSNVDMTKDSLGRGSLSPLFRLADQDHGISDVPIFFCLAVVPFLGLLWTRWMGWVTSVFGRCFPSSAKDLQAMDDGDDYDDDGEISFRRSIHTTGAVISKQQVRTTADAERSEFRHTGGAGAGGVLFTTTGEADPRSDSERVPLESSTLGTVGNIAFACGSASGTIPLPISKAFIQERIDHSSRSSSWSVSPIAQEGPPTKAFRGGKMMGQYLQQSRRTASQTDLGLGMSPLLPVVPLSTWSAGGGSRSQGTLVQGGPLCIPRITVNGTEYDRVFEQLVNKALEGCGRGRGGSGGGSVHASGASDDGDEEYGIETMCPVSLEGLLYVDEEEEDGMVRGERGDRVMEVALADSSEIRGIDLSFLPSLIRPADTSAPTEEGKDLPGTMGSCTAAILHARAQPLPPAPKVAPPTLPMRS
ncbi:unnamed protein product [Mortierella alpina]